MTAALWVQPSRNACCMFFPPIQEWLSSTSSWRHARSDELKALDAAIEEANRVYEAGQTALVPFYINGKLDVSNSVYEIEAVYRAHAIANVRRAFNRWAASQTQRGNNWRKSVRNNAKAMEKLAERIKTLALEYAQKVQYTMPEELPADGRPFAYSQTQQTVHQSMPQDWMAMRLLVRARNESIPALFNGCVCILKADKSRLEELNDDLRKAKAARRVGQVAHKAYKIGGSPNLVPQVSISTGSGGEGAGLAGRIMAEVESMMSDVILQAFGERPEALSWQGGEEFFKNLFEEAFGSIKEEIAAIVPGVGLAVSGATVLVRTVQLVQNGMSAHRMVKLTQKLEEGDPKAALESLMSWQQRDLVACTSKLARASANLGSQVANALTGGTATAVQLGVGIANAIVALLEMIAELGFQYKESRALTKYLEAHNRALSKNLDDPKPTHSNEIFAKSSLAAAYYLLNVPVSHFALQLVEMGAPAWQEDVEYLTRSGKLSTMHAEAERLISASRYKLVRRGDNGGELRDRVGKTAMVKAQELVGMSPLRGTKSMDSYGSDKPLPVTT